MNIKESLEANKEEILKNLPSEFHADFENSLKDVQEEEDLSEDEIKAEVAANIEGEFSEHAGDLSNELFIPPALTEEEEKAEILSALPQEFHADFEKHGKGGQE